MRVSYFLKVAAVDLSRELGHQPKVREIPKHRLVRSRSCAGSQPTLLADPACSAASRTNRPEHRRGPPETRVAATGLRLLLNTSCDLAQEREIFAIYELD